MKNYQTSTDPLSHPLYPRHSLPRLDIRQQVPVEGLAAYRHLDLIEGVLHDIVCIELVDTLNDYIDIWLVGLCEDEKFRACVGPAEISIKARYGMLLTRLRW